MMNKPKGVVSATSDDKNKTVLDVLFEQEAESLDGGPGSLFDKSALNDLHIVGRLDYNSTGLLLITNDGQWSRRLSLPDKKTEKRYRVTVELPLTDEYVDAFASGMYFSYENITTRPAVLNIVSSSVAEVTLIEGRYHQIKRMFGRFQNTVLELHRISVGDLLLDDSLMHGESRHLTQGEIHCF